MLELYCSSRALIYNAIYKCQKFTGKHLTLTNGQTGLGLVASNHPHIHTRCVQCRDGLKMLKKSRNSVK